MTDKKLYCAARAQELHAHLGLTFKQLYEQAEREWLCKSRAYFREEEYDDDSDEGRE